MKKVALFMMLGLAVAPVSAQYRDTVITLQDTDVYMINPVPSSLSKGPDWGSVYGGLMVQQYVPHDTVTVYGIALTMRDARSIDSIYQESRNTALLMRRAPGVADSVYTEITYAGTYTITYKTLTYLDSVQMDTSQHIGFNYTKFRYEFSFPKPYSLTVPCYEIYFDTPWVMTDTFFVGRKYRPYINYPVEYAGFNEAPTPPYSFCYNPYSDTVVNDNTPFRYWGFAFPIIGFHCKPLDEENHGLTLTDLTGDGVTVQWYKVEDGATYNVRVTSIDGSVDTIAVTTDSNYTFSGLPTNTRYTVQVRKQCYYATASYDTTVYSPWTTEQVSFLLGSDACLPVTNVVAEVSSDTAVVSWDNGSDYTTLLMRHGYGNEPHSLWTDIDVSGDTSYTFTGLELGRSYGVALQGFCESVGTESYWSAPVYFYTVDTTGGGTGDTTGGGTGVLSVEGMDFAVNPNPVHGVVEVTLSRPLGANGVLVLYDLGGREVRQQSVPAGSIRVDFDTKGCPAGAYLLKLIIPEGISTRRLLVE